MNKEKKKGIFHWIWASVGLPFKILFFLLGCFWIILLAGLAFSGAISIIEGIKSLIKVLQGIENTEPFVIFSENFLVIPIESKSLLESSLLVFFGILMLGGGFYGLSQFVEGCEKEKGLFGNLLCFFTAIITLACLAGVIYHFIIAF